MDRIARVNRLVDWPPAAARSSAPSDTTTRTPSSGPVSTLCIRLSAKERAVLNAWAEARYQLKHKALGYGSGRWDLQRQRTTSAAARVELLELAKALAAKTKARAS